MDAVKDIWGYAEPLVWVLTLVGALYLFLKDPIRRTRFLGFLPTVVVAVMDLRERKVLVCKLHDTGLWILPQGRVEGSLLDSVREVLFRELGLERTYRLGGVAFLGTVAMRKAQALEKFMDPSEVSIFTHWRGKAYTAFFVETSVSAALAEISHEFLYSEVKFVSVAEARELLGAGHRNGKAQVYLRLMELVAKRFGAGENEKQLQKAAVM